MAKKRKELGMVKPALALTGASVALGVGSQVTVAAGGSAAGLGAMAGFMPAAGAAMGAGVVVGQLRKLEKAGKVKKRRI